MRISLVLALAFLFVVPVQATTITFTVDPALTGSFIKNSQYDFHSSDLNGTPLNGQAMSIDAIFANNILARVGMFYPNWYWVNLIFTTSATTGVGHGGAVTGFLLNPDGQITSTIGGCGGGYADNGWFTIGCGTMRTDTTVTNYIDLSGTHFDTTFTNAPATITDTVMRITTFGGHNPIMFGTAAQLPEPSSLALLPLGLIGLVLVKRKRCRL